MTFLPAASSTAPVWNSDTDEEVHVVNGVAAAGAGIVLVPPQCTYVALSLTDISSGTQEVFVSSDAADVNSGIVMENGAGGTRFLGFPVTPGTTFFIHTGVADSANVNVVRFYTKK